LEHSGPIAIRYPKGQAGSITDDSFEYGKAKVLRNGNKVTFAALGCMVQTALECCESIDGEVVDIRSASPVDFDTIFKSAEKTGLLVTVEDNILSGGVGETIAAEAKKRGMNFKVITKGFRNEFVPAGKRDKLFEIYGLDAESIKKEIEEILNENKA